MNDDDKWSQIPLVDEPSLYHARMSGRAYFGMLSFPNGRGEHAAHKVYDVAELPWRLQHIDRSFDSYISQAEFLTRSRRSANVKSIGLNWVDLDDLELVRLGDAGAIKRIHAVLEEEHIPPPSLIVLTGGGYHVMWLYVDAVTPEKQDVWSLLTQSITHRLHGSLHADKKCTDAARVLRIAGTMNTKRMVVAKIVHTNFERGEAIRYDFDWLAEQVLGAAPADTAFRDEVKPERRKPSGALIPNALTIKGFELAPLVAAEALPSAAPQWWGASLWWRRFQDIRTLCRRRNWTATSGGVPEGMRDQVLFLSAVALSYVARPETFWHEVKAVAREFTPRLPEREWRQTMKPVFNRLAEMNAQNQAEHPAGFETRYKYTTARIIAELAITPHEQAELRVLIGDAIYTERRRVANRLSHENARRAAGTNPRELYLAEAAELHLKIRALHASGLSKREVARRLDIAESSVRYALQKQIWNGS